MREIYEGYGIHMPIKAKYKRRDNRIYFVGDFEDGEDIVFFDSCAKPSSCARGSAFYINKSAQVNLINVKDLYE